MKDDIKELLDEPLDTWDKVLITAVLGILCMGILFALTVFVAVVAEIARS